MKIVKKHKKEKEIEAVILLDASGSMISYGASVVSSTNEYINKIRNEGMLVSLYTFDSSGIVELYYKLKNGRAIELDEYRPGDLTPLYDAMGTVIKRHEGPGKIFIIHTDGVENFSKEFKFESINKLIKERTEKENCQFIYLGEGVEGRTSVQDFYKGQKFYFTDATRAATMTLTAGESVAYAAAGGSFTKEEEVDVDKTVNVNYTPKLKTSSGA